MTPERVRLILGLSADVVPDDTMAEAIALAQSWCDAKASAYRITPPDSAVADMALFYLRNYLDTAGIKPSSLSMPDLSMSTDFRSACDMLRDMAEEAIKDAARGRGRAFVQLRSGVVQRWH